MLQFLLSLIFENNKIINIFAYTSSYLVYTKSLLIIILIQTLYTIMQNIEKSFVTCFDKDCEDFAELLKTLVSERSSIRNIKQKKKDFDKQQDVTSDEYVLTIGNKSSIKNIESFKSQYNKYGIHIGYIGHKAWICCEKFDWDKRSRTEFHKELIILLDQLGMCTDNIDDTIAEYVKRVKRDDSMDSVLGCTLAQTVLLSSIVYFNLFQENKFIFLWRKLCNLFSSSQRRKEQYKLAVVLFYHKYLNDFLQMYNKEDDKNEDSKKKDR